MPDTVTRPSLVTVDRQPRIVIVGGSLTGTATALLLLAAGFDNLTVYEAASASGQQGGGLISLEHPALDLLDRLGIDQTEYLTGPSQHIEHSTLMDRRPTGTVRRTYPGRFTTWTLLHRALGTRLPAGHVHRGTRILGLSDRPGRPVLTTTDGDLPPADLIVFADGRASTGRHLLDPGRTLRYTGYVAHRGTAPALIDPQADFLRLEPGPGTQFNIAPVPGGADWTFYLPATADHYRHLFGKPPHQRTFALPHHVSPAAHTLVNDQATRLLPPQQAGIVHITGHRAAVPIMDIDPPTRMVWPVGAGHAVLLGDALAPVRPHTARGANNGIEQAAGLVTAVTQHLRHHADLAGALNGWQRRHLPTVGLHLRLGAQIAARLRLGQTPVEGPATPHPVGDNIPTPAAAANGMTGSRT
jgi:2-polyprenyl-6-methoxyphenol hydroxylase-like FAD-dependent oxidoreductase